jgi:hypothetical protein
VSDGPLPLLDRLAERLAGEPRPVRLEALARELLRLRKGGSPAGPSLLVPLLSADPRFVETPEGWTLERKAGETGGTELEGPFAALGLAPDPRREGARLWAIVSCDADGSETARRVGGSWPGGGGEQKAAPLPSRDLPGVSRRGAPDWRAAGLEEAPARPIPLGRLARALAGVPAVGTLGRLAARLGLHHRLEEGALGEARLAAALWLDLRERLREERLLDRASFDRLLGGRPGEGEIEGPFGPEELAALPAVTGVYRFLDRERRLLYVGKSVNLRARVTSYFAGPARDDKDRRLRRETAELRAEELGSEPEALLREQELIRRHRPPLNRQRQVGARTGPRGDRVLVLPGPTPRRRTLLMLRGGVLAARITVGLRRDGRARARRELLGVYFEDAPATEGVEAMEGGHLVASWLRRHPHRALSFDPRDCADAAEAVRRLERFLEADPRQGPLFELDGSRR